MLGKDRKFGDLLFVAAMFPLACAVVGAASTRTSRHLAAKQAQAAQVVVKRAVAKTCASPLPARRAGMPKTELSCLGDAARSPRSRRGRRLPQRRR